MGQVVAAAVMIVPAAIWGIVQFVIGHNRNLEEQAAQARTNAIAREKLKEIKTKYEYKEGCFHVAVTGATSTGKSSLINALRGLRDKDPGAAVTGDGETTQEFARYVHPQSPKLVWYDIPGSGSSNHPSWEYFSKQSLFLFDAIIVVIGAAIMETDIQLIQLARSQNFPIPCHLVRAKSDTHITNTLNDRALDDSDSECVERVKGEVREAAEAAARCEIDKAELPSDTRFYQVNKRTMLAITTGDNWMVKKFGPYQIDEQRLIDDLLEDIQNRVSNRRLLA